MDSKKTISDIATALSKGDATIRLYARMGQEYLSEGANSKRKKLFTPADTKIIHYISLMRDGSKSDTEIEQGLKAGAYADTPEIDLDKTEIIAYAEQSQAIMTLQDKIQELETELVQARAYETRYDELKQQYDLLRDDLETIRKESNDSYKQGFKDGADMFKP